MEDRVLNSEEFRERAFEKVAERLKEGISSRPSPRIRGSENLARTGHLLTTAIELLETLEVQHQGQAAGTTASALAGQLEIAKQFVGDAHEAYEMALESQAAA